MQAYNRESEDHNYYPEGIREIRKFVKVFWAKF